MKKLLTFSFLFTACLIALHLFARGAFSLSGGEGEAWTATLALTWP